MIIEKIRSEVVAHLSYFIGSQTEAIVIDPRRDCQIYVNIAQREHMRIKYIFETHRNEDYVIGSMELASLTDAEIYHGPWPIFKYGKTLKDGQEFWVGHLKVTAIHTPGHTPGCMSYAITDLDSGEETVLVYTGDTLFVNEVGRTDFGGFEKRREWSSNLYHSIFKKLLPLGDHVILCPAHGAGSVCGAGIADREWSTLGLERRLNPVLQKTKEEFIEYKVNEHHDYAPYFRLMEKLNVEGAPFLGCGPTPAALSPGEFQEVIEQGAMVVDTRSPNAFSGAHIKGAYSIPITLLSMVGWILPYDKSILLVVNDTADLGYATLSLARIGYDNVIGYLSNGFHSWVRAAYPLESSGLLMVRELKEKLDAGEEWILLDVRSQGEWDEEHIDGALHIYVGFLVKRLKEVPTGCPVVCICASGVRASVAASILLRNGHRDVYILCGGMIAWKAAGYPTI